MGKSLKASTHSFEDRLSEWSAVAPLYCSMRRSVIVPVLFLSSFRAPLSSVCFSFLSLPWIARVFAAIQVPALCYVPDVGLRPQFLPCHGPLP